MTCETPLRALVVDDDRDARHGLTGMLEADGWRVTAVGTAAEALDRGDWDDYTALILDRGLPDGTADELLPQLRRLAPQAEVVIVSDSADVGGAVAAFRQGAADYILKPIDPGELRARLGRIAEHRRARRELRKQQTILRLVLDTISDGVLVVDAAGRVILSNLALERMAGPVPAGAGPDGWPQGPAFLQDEQPLARALRGERVEDAEQFFLPPEGHDGHWVSASASPLRDAAGTTRGAVVVLRDISERKRVEEELRQSERLLQNVLDHAPGPISIKDCQGRLLLVNRRFVELTGRSLWDVVGRTDHDVFGGPELQAMRANDRAALAGEELMHFEEVLDRPDGPRTFLTAKVPADGLGFPGRVLVGFGTDITALKQAQDRVRASEQHLRQVLDSLPAFVGVMGPDGVLQEINRAALEAAGLRAEDVLGRPLEETYWWSYDAHVQGRLRAAIRRAARGEASRYDEVVRLGEDRRTTIDFMLAPMRDEQGRVTHLIPSGIDISKRKRAEERLLQSERLAAIGQMVTGLAHESGNALQRSQACLQMLANRLRDRPEVLDLVDRVQAAQDHLLHLYEDVRGYAANLRLQPEACDLADAWRQAWADLELARRGRRAELREFLGGLGRRVWADPFRLKQVFRNVLENALAATPDPLVIDVRLSEAEHHGRPALRVAVRDNGPGVPSGQRAQVFEPFFTTKTKGTGLGMAIARRIVEAHDGEIALGEGGPGCEVVITLPREAP